MTILSTPPQNEFLDQRSVVVRDGTPLPFLFAQVRPTTAWTTFFSNAYQLLNALTLSGTTANRPTKFLFVGRTYFDTSLGAHGKPIWVASVSGVTATWIDSASNIV
jgi:hypothetical protein